MAVEIILIVIGVIFMVASFFITEKLSSRELGKMAELSRDEMKQLLERNLKEAKRRVDDMIEDVIDRSVDDSMDQVERALEKVTNEKIQAVSEYSDTVLEEINKTHNEVMFLYSMLNDKHTELTTYAGRLAELAGALEDLEKKIENTVSNSDAIIQKAQQVQKAHQVQNLPAAAEKPRPAAAQEVPAVKEEKEKEPENPSDQKQMILSMYKEGKSVVEIAKELGLGVGEVKLIIGLFREEEM